MPAFLCSPLHIAHIAAWAKLRNLTANPGHLAMTLRSLNNSALAARYGDKPKSLPRGFAAEYLPASESYVYSMFKDGGADDYAHALIDCLIYQCSEGDVMESLRAKALHALKREAVRVSGKQSGFPNVWAI